ncbi:uncharacterized protein PADG_00989 [Paracoccidioides brasiliensis Pb18]|uniref:Uncharacterized protein n=2 Tax=Paracoccidioides brasiliensis TaxID=121759 RepID=C1FYW3_PARBD|nr:uncharacterized protein PADG_00989 [Paracoccidioides brasiliensis Pb18]EEH44700.2 hypothetical protein PADG_00989 [Paracoccidioides brasiliensis Pb18]ODH14018.1 hypothetical protein ACO22_06728 [Paracoccidioides brasiliensis]ODH46613.1 hypothetical protein GX48_07308 [Paracoccidioides brasiliensis]
MPVITLRARSWFECSLNKLDTELECLKVVKMIDMSSSNPTNQDDVEPSSPSVAGGIQDAMSSPDSTAPDLRHRKEASSKVTPQMWYSTKLKDRAPPTRKSRPIKCECC